MQRWRVVVGSLTAIGIIVALLAQWRAFHGDARWIQLTLLPLLVLVFLSWGTALTIATRIGRTGRTSLPPGAAQLYGLALASARAPRTILALAGLGLLGALALGRTGSLHGMPTTPAEARIAGSVVLIFLSISLPTLAPWPPGEE